MDKPVFLRRIYKKRIESKFNQIEAYAETIDLFINREIKETEKRYEEEYAKTKPKEQNMIEDMYLDDLILLENLFPKILWSSLFATCYSVLEYELNSICRNIRSIKQLSLKPSDLKNIGIFQSQLYLKKVVGIKFPDRERPWQNIKYYNRIRNAIIHNEGRLSDSNNDKKTKDYIITNPSLSFDETDAVVLTRKFILEVIETIKSFFKVFFESWKKFDNNQLTNA